MAARHDEDATGGGTTPPKGDGQIAGPEDPSQLSQNNGSIQGGERLICGMGRAVVAGTTTTTTSTSYVLHYYKLHPKSRVTSITNMNSVNGAARYSPPGKSFLWSRIFIFVPSGCVLSRDRNIRRFSTSFAHSLNYVLFGVSV